MRVHATHLFKHVPQLIFTCPLIRQLDSPSASLSISSPPIRAPITLLNSPLIHIHVQQLELCTHNLGSHTNSDIRRLCLPVPIKRTTRSCRRSPVSWLSAHLPAYSPAHPSSCLPRHMPRWEFVYPPGDYICLFTHRHACPPHTS